MKCAPTPEPAMHRLFVTAAVLAAATATAQTLTVGTYSAPNDANAAGQARSLTAFVKQATGKEASNTAFTSYDALAEALAKGTVDVALVPPLAYVRAERQGAKLEPLARVVR